MANAAFILSRHLKRLYCRFKRCGGAPARRCLLSAWIAIKLHFGPLSLFSNLYRITSTFPRSYVSTLFHEQFRSHNPRVKLSSKHLTFHMVSITRAKTFHRILQYGFAILIILDAHKRTCKWTTYHSGTFFCKLNLSGRHQKALMNDKNVLQTLCPLSFFKTFRQKRKNNEYSHLILITVEIKKENNQTCITTSTEHAMHTHFLFANFLGSL